MWFIFFGENNAADALSRLAVLDPKPFDIHEELLIREIVTSAANSMALNWEEIEKESIEDEEIQNVRELIRTDQQMKLQLAYRVIAKELCQVGNVLLRTDRLVIPGRLRNRVLSLAHEGHPGSRMMKTHLRTHVWWPKLDQDVDRFVKSCRGCCLVSAPEAPEPMVRKEMPSAPWEDVAVDFLGPLPDGLYLLVVVDYYSRYVEVKEMISINVQAVIEELSVIFGRYGLPVSLRADNGPQLSENCNELKTFCLENGIKLVNTIPYWPQQNGEVERQNRTILKRLRIAQELGKSWRKELSQYLLVYHSTNHPTTGKSPSELMFGRRIRSKLPQVPVYHSNDEEVRDMDRLQKEKGREYSDKKRKANHSKIEVGDEVLIKRMKKNNKLDTDYINEEFVVVRKQEADCTLKSIKTGREYRRNVAHLKKIEKTTSNEGSVSQYGNEEGESNVNNNEALTEQNRTNRTRKEPHHFKDYVPY